MRTIDGVALFGKIVFGWLPREPGAASGPTKKPPAGLTGRLAQFFAFEALVVFVSLCVFQLAGLGSYPGFVAGAVAPVAAGAGSVLFLKQKRGELHAEVAGLEIPARQLDHVIDNWLLGLIVEGTASEADQRESQDRLAALRKGATVSYDLITDDGKAITGSACISRVVIRARPDGRSRFKLRMRRMRA